MIDDIFLGFFFLSLRSLVYILYLSYIPVWTGHLSSPQCYTEQ